MGWLRRTGAVIGSVCVALGVCCAAGPPAGAGAPSSTPTARTTVHDPTVGPIFRSGLGSKHSCTASIVDSGSGDLIVTAAHCVAGDPVGWLFVPGYDDGIAPHLVWTISQAYADPHWIDGRDPHYDVVVLRLAPKLTAGGRRIHVEDVVKGNRLGAAPVSGQSVTAIAYNAGIDDRPVRCTVPAYLTHGYPSFDCRDYVGGSSGSPWLSRFAGNPYRYLVGVIGGLYQGGCHDYTSYSPPFSAQIRTLVFRGAHGRPSDVLPSPGPSGC